MEVFLTILVMIHLAGLPLAVLICEFSDANNKKETIRVRS